MADAYSFALVVDLDGDNIPKLKNKLVKYFQSKKSNGGDCQIEHEDRSATAVLRFRTEEDRQRVLEKKAHEIKLEKGVLRMTVRLPEEEKSQPQETPSDNLNKTCGDKGTPVAVSQTETDSRDDQTEDDKRCSTSAVLENIPHSMSHEFLEMLVENILKNCDSPAAAQNFSLEVMPEISSAVVNFQNGKENTDFMSSCPKNRMFKSKQLFVRPLEVTAKVRIEDIPAVSQDHLLLYFENEGVDVEEVMLNEEEQSADITFKTHTDVLKIIKKKHNIQQKLVKAFPYYESLGSALYGKDRPTLNLPDAFSESIDHAIWTYLHDKPEAAETIHGDLAKHFCEVDLRQSTVHFSPLPSLLHRKGVKAKDITEWTQTVKTAFTQSLTKFDSLKFQPEMMAWEEAEKKIKEALLNEAVVVVPDKARGFLSVVGFAGDVSKLEQTVEEILEEIGKRVQREKLIVIDEIEVSPSIFHILCQGGLQDKVLNDYPELKMSYKKESQRLALRGLNHEVLGVVKRVVSGVTALKRRILEVDQFVLEFLNGEDQEELTSVLLTSKKIDAAFEVSAETVQLLGIADRALDEAETQLKTLLISQYIDVEDSNVLRKSEWQNLVTCLEDDNNSSFRKIMIQTIDRQTNQQVVVTGYKDSVKPVSSELDDFLQQNAEVEESVVVKPNIIVTYIEEYHRNAWLDQVKDKVMVSFRKEKICLSGSRINVTNCKTLFEDLVSSVYIHNLKISKPGAKKFFQDKKAMYVSSVMSETGCLVQLVDENSGKQDQLASGKMPKPVYHIDTADGVEIAVYKADLCSHPVSAVVNASNQNLQHDGGLAKALLDAAGPQLQDECNKIINSNGQLNPGDCVMTDAGGRLSCKKIIHAVGPRFDQANPQRAMGQLKRVVKGSLELAEAHGCLSVALPAISRSLGFPLNLCAETIIRAVKEHCDDKYGENTLKRIHLVNNDDHSVQAMDAAVRKEFGRQDVSHSQHSQPSTSTQTLPVKHVPNTSSSEQAVTKEGLNIILKRGNIQDATTDVIVNSVAEDLDLRRGAVSCALFGVAGQKLQELVREKQNKANLGDIIITDACKLKSKQVFHAVAPHWNNGKGAVSKILSGLFKDCLGHAEDNGLTSISFPAIGTGNLGFPRDLAASLIFDEILSFSSKKQPKHLKTVVIILHPSDAQTIQAVMDEFNKRFSTTSGGPVPSTTTQSTGPFSKITSSSGMHETKMGNVTVQIVTGDITKEVTDVIVNSSNDSFTLKSGVSLAILNAAGPAVEAECTVLGGQPNPGIILTQPGNLKCKNILHLVGQTDPVKISKSVKAALQVCVNGSYTSISFPALGTGQGNVQASQVADAMFDAVVDVLSQANPNPLKMIRIVIFQQGMLKDFHTSMQKKEVSDTKDKEGLWGKIKAFFTGGTTGKPQKDENFVIDGQEVEPACFHICSDSQPKVDAAKQWIGDLISKEQQTNHFKDKAILSLSPADQQRIIDIQNTTGVNIKIEYKKPDAMLTIEGLSKDVLKATNEIHEMLKRVRDEEHFKKNVDLAGTLVDWQYQQQGLQFNSFDPESNYHLEDAFEKKLPHVSITVQGQDYKVTMPNGPAVNASGNTLNIRRVDKLTAQDPASLPQHWDPMPANTSCQVITIQPGTTEYNEVLTLFQATCTLTVMKIERIQNQILWKSLQIKKQDMDQRNGHQNNERRLFHGTCYTTVAYINQHGFNRSYAGKNAAAFGNGTYFAVAARYSASNTYSRPDPQGQKFMYLCRVLTGDYTQGQQGMIVPPAKSATSVQQFDSVVDNISTPSMFVIFHDSLAYPEYLITFK
ncbi:poly(ADP-ribose) polymerase family member 14-related sequence 1 isoform X2 [Myripristis murdjan]|uniref:Poly [ADP-ribose] polymerase n=1 Tax=Myripristis murdjan TaxID=586833 RepID=A0A667YSH5_9TELE|nr:protein mono-ADP-ribosyltransferase PARP14-like isoform X2 [Myripristis murdjan]